MTDWWTHLGTPLQVFYAIGIVAFLLTLIQTLLALLGMGVEGLFDFFHLDIGPTDASGLGLFSSHTISAFFLGFGWGGVVALEGGLSVVAATGVGAVCGIGLMAAMFFLLRGLLSLQSSGNLDYSTAVGSEATVYVTIPGDNHDGGGQIQVLIGGRLVTAGARKTGSGAVPPGERVRVVGMAGPTHFLVDDLGAASTPKSPNS